MSEQYEEQIALNRTRPARPESPALEGAASKAIEGAFRELIEKSYFYQKVTIDLTGMDAAVKASILLRKIQRGPSSDPFRREDLIIEATAERLEELHAEVRARPWRLATRHIGDNPSTAEMHQLDRTGGQPVGIAVKDMDLHFYLPPVTLHCAACKTVTTFTALVSSNNFVRNPDCLVAQTPSGQASWSWGLCLSD